MHSSIVSLAAILSLATSTSAFHGRLAPLNDSPFGQGVESDDVQLSDLDANAEFRSVGFPGFFPCIDRCLVTFEPLFFDGGKNPPFEAFLSRDLQNCTHLDLKGNLGGGQVSCCDEFPCEFNT